MAKKSTLAQRRAARKEYEQAAKKPVGKGSRFKAIAKSAKLGGAREPEAVAAAVGRAKFGQKKMTKMAVAGKKRKK